MILTSNYQPLKTEYDSFPRVFNKLFIESSSVNIVTGYVSENSIKYLEEVIYKNGGPYLNLIIGMHYFDKFTHSQYTAAIDLENFLETSALGSVNLVTSFPFHGKMYSFVKNGTTKCIMGSSNLDNVLPQKAKVQYETDFFLDDELSTRQIQSFIGDLSLKASEKLSSLEINDFRNTNNLLEGLSVVQKLEKEQVENFKSDVLFSNGFQLPLKPYEVAKKSNLHPYLGKGRENKSTGIILPRSWYEVELIVPKEILDLPNYPQKQSSFEVLTDDGYRFECKTSGDYGKNLRSEKDLKILGKWIKGRMQEAGVIKAGQKITQSVLDDYGRDNISFFPTKINGLWFLDFSNGSN